MNPSTSRSDRRNLPTRSGALLALLAAAAIGAACSDGAAAASLTRDEWIEQADAVCVASEARFAEAYDAAGEDPTPAEIEVLFDAVIVEVGHQLDGIADLTPPEAIRADVDAFLVEARGALEEAGALDPQEAYAHEVSPFDPALAVLQRARRDRLRRRRTIRRDHLPARGCRRHLAGGDHHAGRAASPSSPPARCDRTPATST